MSARRAVVAALLALLPVAPLVAEPKVEVTLDPKSVTVGDRIAATLVVRLDAGDRRTPRFPDWSRGWGKLTALAAPPATRTESPSGVEWRQTLELAAFEVGRLDLPPLGLPLEPATGDGATPHELATPSGLAIEVRSLLPAETEEIPPKPADPPRRLPLPKAFWWSAAAFTLAALALGLLVARRKRGAGASGAASRLSPRAELERALDALAGVDPVAALAALSLSFRRYLGRALTLPAAESTTSELAQRLAARALDRATVQRAVRLLREVDQVKFARRAADAAELAGRVVEARAVADEIERNLHPPAVPEAPAPDARSAA